MCSQRFFLVSVSKLPCVWVSVVSLHVAGISGCLCGQYCNTQKKSLAVQWRSWLNIVLFLIAFSAAAADHNPPVPHGLHRWPPGEHYNPLRGEGEASSQVGICGLWFCICDAVRRSKKKYIYIFQVGIQHPPIKFSVRGFSWQQLCRNSL